MGQKNPGAQTARDQHRVFANETQSGAVRQRAFKERPGVDKDFTALIRSESLEITSKGKRRLRITAW